MGDFLPLDPKGAVVQRTVRVPLKLCVFACNLGGTQNGGFLPLPIRAVPWSGPEDLLRPAKDSPGLVIPYKALKTENALKLMFVFLLFCWPSCFFD